MEKEYPRRSKLKNEEIDKVLGHFKVDVKTEEDLMKEEREEKRKVGRPKQEIRKEASIVLKVTEEEKRKVDEIAKKLNVNRSKLLRYLIFGEIEKTDFVRHMDEIPLMQEVKKELIKLNKTMGWIEEN